MNVGTLEHWAVADVKLTDLPEQSCPVDHGEQIGEMVVHQIDVQSFPILDYRNTEDDPVWNSPVRAQSPT